MKLAEALTAPGVTGDRGEVTGWLFLAAGIAPSAEDVAAVEDQLPSIEEWPHPAAIFDFTWTLWRANDALLRTVGVPASYRGKNYIELFFDSGGGIRRHLDRDWRDLAEVTLRLFRARTDRRRDQRWHKKLIARLHELPEFGEIWERAQGAEPPVVQHRATAAFANARFGVVTLTVTADPRLQLVQGIPEDETGSRVLAKLSGTTG